LIAVIDMQMVGLVCNNPWLTSNLFWLI